MAYWTEFQETKLDLCMNLHVFLGEKIDITICRCAWHISKFYNKCFVNWSTRRCSRFTSFRWNLKLKWVFLSYINWKKISFIRTIISVKMIILDTSMQSLKIWLIQFVISIFMVSNINSILIDVITQNVLQKISLGPPPPSKYFRIHASKIFKILNERETNLNGNIRVQQEYE